MSIRLARFALEHYQDDPTLRGFVYVEFDGEIIRAFPSNDTMWLNVPSREWVEKYRDAVWALIMPLENDPRYWCWCGIAILKNPQIEDAAFTEWLTDYPHVRMFFTENWKYVFNDTDGRNTFRIVHEDGTIIQIDRTTDAETIRIFDGVTGHEVLLDPDQIRVTHGKTGAVITLDAEGNISITAPEQVQITTTKETVINAKENVEVNTEKDVNVKAGGTIKLDAGSQLAGVITGRSVDPYTGFNHIDASTSVKATK